jgi:hypothetical protein
MGNNKTEVESFLRDLKIKIDFWGIALPRTRENFIETLKKLGYVPSQCIEVIKGLTYEDYYKGPSDDKINTGNYWEFGVMVEGIQIYIKINFGLKDKSVICISFHEAEFKINYPLKGK